MCSSFRAANLNCGRPLIYWISWKVEDSNLCNHLVNLFSKQAQSSALPTFRFACRTLSAGLDINV